MIQINGGQIPFDVGGLVRSLLAGEWVCVLKTNEVSRERRTAQRVELVNTKTDHKMTIDTDPFR